MTRGVRDRSAVNKPCGMRPGDGQTPGGVIGPF